MLLASGLIVGEGLVGVVLAAIVAFSGKDFPLQLVSDSFADGGAMIAGSVGFALLVALCTAGAPGSASKLCKLVVAGCAVRATNAPQITELRRSPAVEQNKIGIALTPLTIRSHSTIQSLNRRLSYSTNGVAPPPLFLCAISFGGLFQRERLNCGPHIRITLNLSVSSESVACPSHPMERRPRDEQHRGRLNRFCADAQHDQPAVNTRPASTATMLFASVTVARMTFAPPSLVNSSRHFPVGVLSRYIAPVSGQGALRYRAHARCFRKPIFLANCTPR